MCFLSNENVKSASLVADALGSVSNGFEVRKSTYRENQKYVLETSFSSKIGNVPVDGSITIGNDGTVRMDIPANYKDYINGKLNDDKFSDYTSSKEKAGLARGKWGKDQIKGFSEDYKKIFV